MIRVIEKLITSRNGQVKRQKVDENKESKPKFPLLTLTQCRAKVKERQHLSLEGVACTNYT